MVICPTLESSERKYRKELVPELKVKTNQTK